MELIRISDRKLKIMLTPTDMCHFELSNGDFGEDSQKMRRAFRNLLKEVKRQIDFDADGERLSIQYFPSREGGCEMFLTHLQPLICANEAKENLPVARFENDLSPFSKYNTMFHHNRAYRFDGIDDLLSVCRRLVGCGYIGESSAYTDEQKRYFLILSITTASPFSTPEELQFILEYGILQSAAEIRLYIREHGSVICEKNAVDTLSSRA